MRLTMPTSTSWVPLWQGHPGLQLAQCPEWPAGAPTRRRAVPQPAHVPPANTHSLLSKLLQWGISGACFGASPTPQHACPKYACPPACLVTRHYPSPRIMRSVTQHAHSGAPPQSMHAQHAYPRTRPPAPHCQQVRARGASRSASTAQRSAAPAAQHAPQGARAALRRPSHQDAAAPASRRAAPRPARAPRSAPITPRRGEQQRPQHGVRQRHVQQP
jgi:hypothetical protein